MTTASVATARLVAAGFTPAAAAKLVADGGVPLFTGAVTVAPTDADRI